MSEHWLPFRIVSFDSSNKVRFSVWFKKIERGYFPPHPQKVAHFMAEISGEKGVSLIQSCLRKLTDLNIDKCSCLVFVTLGNSHKYLYQKLQSILAVMPSGSCKYHFRCWQAGFVCSVSAWAEHVPVSSKVSSLAPASVLFHHTRLWCWIEVCAFMTF